MHLKLKISWEDMDALADGSGLTYETEDGSVVIEVLHYNSFTGKDGIEIIENLKTCPFCGAEARIATTYDDVCFNGIECTMCDAGLYGQNQEETTKIWNKRVQ